MEKPRLEDTALSCLTFSIVDFMGWRLCFRAGLLLYFCIFVFFQGSAFSGQGTSNPAWRRSTGPTPLYRDTRSFCVAHWRTGVGSASTLQYCDIPSIGSCRRFSTAHRTTHRPDQKNGGWWVVVGCWWWVMAENYGYTSRRNPGPFEFQRQYSSRGLY